MHRIRERPESLPIPDLLWVDSQYTKSDSSVYMGGIWNVILKITFKYKKNGTASVNVVIDMALRY